MSVNALEFNSIVNQSEHEGWLSDASIFYHKKEEDPFALCNDKTQDNVKLKADSQQFVLEVDSFPKLKIYLDASLKLTLLVGKVELQLPI